MRSLGKVCLWLGIAALMLLVMPGLVHTSAAEAPPQEQSPLSAIIRCVADVPSPAIPGAVPQEQVPPRWAASMPTPRSEAAPHTVLCDGNGWPLTGGTWTREAWAANPPEGIPGS